MTELHDDPGAAAASGGDLPAGFAVGEYRIERLLGRGGMGTVYAAQQPEIGARVAVKVLAAELSRDPRVVQRFVDEARAANKIRHPGIIDIFSFGRLPDGRLYFVMELLDGETLAARLARGPLPPSEARRLLLQICEALQAAHEEKIVHRDLKPENLWIATPRHGQPYAKILDFGIAKLVEGRDASMATETGVAMGTAHFMAPEQCRGEAVDQRTDVYAIGVLLYMMWSGRLPFEGSTFLGVVTQQISATPLPPSAHRPVPARLERLILCCLEKDPARRPSSARALGDELGAALAEALPGETLAPASPVPHPSASPGPSLGLSPTLSPSPSPSPGPNRRRTLIVAVALIAALFSAGALLAARARSGSVPAPPPAPAPPATEARLAPAPREPALPPPAPPPAARAVAPPLAPRPRPTPPSPARERVAPSAPAEAPASRIDERGFLKENPFR